MLTLLPGEGPAAAAAMAVTLTNDAQFQEHIGLGSLLEADPWLETDCDAQDFLFDEVLILCCLRASLHMISTCAWSEGLSDMKASGPPDC